MNWGVIAFAAGFVILLGIRLLMARARRNGAPFFNEKDGDSETWNVSRLLLVSFLTLFAELAFIRWIAVEVRVFAYVKNLALLLCFVGFGLGCARARKALQWRTAILAFLGLICVVRLPFAGRALEGLSASLGAAPDVEIWLAGNSWNWIHFLIGAALAGVLFLLLVWIFVPLGQVVSGQMDVAPNALSAYSWNLFGSLLGILAFLGASRLMLPPSVWLGTALAGFALLQNPARNRVLVFALIAPLFLFLYAPSGPNRYSMWTPYQQISYLREFFPDGEFRDGYVQVNHTGYQAIVNLSDGFLARHPGLLKESVDENPYNLPFSFSTPAPHVLIVGSGTGNDVAAALRNGSAAVDAVEIDPFILALGKREHPEHPYDSPKVSVHLTDARAFLKRTNQLYDLIAFGLLDSHTQLSDYSNMRIDNFVYTEESFREARARLKPNGVLFIKFQVNHRWMASRLTEMLQQTFGKIPVTFRAVSSYSSGGTIFVISPGERVEEALQSNGRLAQFVAQNRVTPEETVPVTTDDWPYLYQKERKIPRTYFSLGILVLLMGIGLYWQIPEARQHPPSLFFLSMGAGFMLLETQVISRLALFFGTTWQVNGIVIFALLTALLLANLVIERSSNNLSRVWVWIGLVAGLLAAYWFPASRVPGSPAVVGALLAGVFSVPVFFAGMLFSLEFRVASSPSAALGANILGAVVGGLLENLSLVFGMHALLLVTIALYCLAGIGLWARRSEARSLSAATAGIGKI